MDESSIDDWLDRHHVKIIRTHATTLEGTDVGKYVNRPKFVGALPQGHAIADMGLAQDISGFPHVTFWHEFRNSHLGDIKLKPDLDTIIWDGIDPDLGHVICDFVTATCEPISVCPRTLLRRITGEVAELGYQVKAAFELEFFLFRESFEEARGKTWHDLTPVTASDSQAIYNARNAYKAKPFMNEVTKRLNWQHFGWESWSDEGGVGQIELNFSPADPVSAADTLIRVKQIIYEVAVDLGMSVTYMPHPQSGYSSGLHIHHSLLNEAGTPAFVDDAGRTTIFRHWIAGIVDTTAAATSMLCPSINAYRRFSEFAAPPMTASWGEENKSAAVRVISAPASAARVEHRVPASDANPYLALATILAGGISGARRQLEPVDELHDLGWGLPDDIERLPRTISSAAETLAANDSLPAILGQDVVDYWVNTRQWEWINFESEAKHKRGGEPTDWEFTRYFELI